MSDHDLQQRVHNLLAEFTGVDPLKRLFWTELEYRRVNDPLSRRDWPEGTAALLAEDPVLLSEQDGFVVVYARLNDPALSRQSERRVAAKLLSQYPYALFVFSNAERDRWHFLNVKRDGKSPDQRLFRRIAVGTGEQLRTAAERLSLLDLEAAGHDATALEIQDRHDDAFDVEKVTKRFFDQYAQVFGQVERLITGIPEADRKRLFTQRLFNRLMFIAFIQKKGWLKFGGRTDYLEALWRDYKRAGDQQAGFYESRLKVLFFAGLNARGEVDVVGINPHGFVQSLIGEVPYLNGGLFEEDEDDRDAAIQAPDDALDLILHGLFAQFNFTVTESTPLDVEVAVDPEMLGKVFEELVTGRHETGSYYTPKPVVAFMGREALKGYLRSQLPKEKQETLERFVDGQDPGGLRDPEAVLEALRGIKVCDPACGSGAYLLGMLHELLELRQALFNTRCLDPISTYERKLEIIQNSLYGVDIDPFAVNVARLRLWLSLAVDFDGDNPPPLPNLDFKIEAGDSLLAPDPGKSLQMTAREYQVEELLRLKSRFMTAHGGEKRALLKEIDDRKRDIVLWTHGGALVAGFDWPVEFAEVFTNGGFDVVLANPPYVRADAQYRHIEDVDERQKAIDAWKKYRATLLKGGIYHTLYEKWDLYIPFLERGYQLLRPDGQMVFIIPDAYNAAKYATKSHEFFVNHSRIERIDFCSDIPLFDAGVANTILHFAKQNPTEQDVPARVRRWGEKPDDFDVNADVLPTAPQRQAGPSLFRVGGAAGNSRDHAMVELGNICYISYGLRANADDRYWKGEFVTGDLVADIQDTKHPKPFVEGKDLIPWWVKRVRWLEWGTERAPGRFARPTFPQLHEAPEKLIALVVATGGPPVIVDTSRLLTTHTSCMFVPWWHLKGVKNRSIRKTAWYSDEIKVGDAKPSILRDELEALSQGFAPKYLLAVMNSSYARDWLSTRRRSKMHIYPDDWKPLPIFPASSEQQAGIVALVDEILALYEKHGYPLPAGAAQRLAEMEEEIDRKVAELHEQPENVATGRKTGG